MRIEGNEGELPDLKLNYGKLYDEKGVGVIPAIILDDETSQLLFVTEEPQLVLIKLKFK